MSLESRQDGHKCPNITPGWPQLSSLALGFTAGTFKKDSGGFYQRDLLFVNLLIKCQKVKLGHDPGWIQTTLMSHVCINQSIGAFAPEESFRSP